MNERRIDHRAITMLYVADVGRSRDFYRDLVGLDVAMDASTYVELTWGNLILGLRSRDNARAQFPGATSAGAMGASHQVTIEVDDVDEMAALLVAHGIELLQEPTDQPWGMRSTSFRDADGHVWELCTPIE